MRLVWGSLPYFKGTKIVIIYLVNNRSVIKSNSNAMKPRTVVNTE